MNIFFKAWDTIPYVEIPNYIQIRYVTLTSSGFMSCSCGLSHRMKMPCRHILAIVKEPHIHMYGVRWMAQYQHSFERENNIEITKIFRMMEHCDRVQDVKNGEIVNVKAIHTVSGKRDYCFFY